MEEEYCKIAQGLKQALNTRAASGGWIRRVVTPTLRGAEKGPDRVELDRFELTRLTMRPVIW